MLQFAPTMKTNGNIGTFDYQCEASLNCPGVFDWTGVYFTGTTWCLPHQPYPEEL